MLHYLSGTTITSLLACYEALEITLEELPEDPGNFMAAGRQDGLVTYMGASGIWEAVLDISHEQAIRLHGLPNTEVTPVD